MGQMRFLISPQERLTEEVLQLAYMSGLDRTPWLVRVRAEGPLLIVDRSMSGSGNLIIAWHVEGHGLLGLSTATLIERPEPYLLPLELARGAINQLRAHLFEWQAIGLQVPRPVGEKLHAAIQQFSEAVVDQEFVAAVGAIPFEQGELRMVQRPALVIAEHPRELEDPPFAGR